MTIPEFSDFSKLHAWLVSNKQTLLAQKMSTMKKADAFSTDYFLRSKPDANKAAIPADAESIEVESIINTTKILDSHGDVHLDGLWSKSLRENKENYLVKEHNFTFDGIISDNVKASARDILWSDLGYSYPGSTQALTYVSIIDKSDTTGMFDKYRTGKVKQHSVGMRYIKVALAVDNKRYPDEEKVWKTYYDLIVNKADVDKLGYFWAVSEAKNIEGSAVVKGSNFVTPTTSVQEVKDEPEKSTHQEPLYKTLQLKTPVVNSIYNLKI